MTSLRERVEAEIENIERTLAELPEARPISDLSTLEWQEYQRSFITYTAVSKTSSSTLSSVGNSMCPQAIPGTGT